MAASASSLLGAAASSSCAAISPRLPRGAPAATSVPSPSRHSCYSLRASPASRHRSRFVASATPTMRPPAESRVPTVVDVDLGDRSYPIYSDAGLLNEPDLLQRHVHGKRVLVVTNTIVAPLYLEKVTWALTHNNPNVSVESVILPNGEKYKNMDTLMKMFDKAVEYQATGQ